MVGAVTVALLAGVLLFIVWLAGLSNKQTKCYDIYFAQGVGGLNKGSNVSFSGVPVGQVKKISLLPNRPEFVWVRIEVDQQTPVLQGTTAQIQGVGFTGVSEIQLDGAVRGTPPISQLGPQGCPVVPATSGGLGALLNSAPELIDRIQRLTERLTELLSDKNQNSIADILENIDATTKVLRRARARPRRRDRATSRIAARNAGIAAQQCSAFSTDNTNRLVNEQGKPAAEDLRKSIASIQQAADNLNAMISRRAAGRSEFQQVDAARGQPAGARPARPDAVAAIGFRPRESEGIGGALGPEKLPDYKPRKRHEAALRTIAPIALAAGARRLLARRPAGRRREAADDAADADPEARRPGANRTHRSAGQAVTIATPTVVAKELRTVRVPGPGQRRPTSNMWPICSGSIRPTSCSRSWLRRPFAGPPTGSCSTPPGRSIPACWSPASCSASATTPDRPGGGRI